MPSYSVYFVLYLVPQVADTSYRISRGNITIRRGDHLEIRLLQFRIILPRVIFAAGK